MKYKTLLGITLLVGNGICCVAQNPITPEGTFFSDPSARQWVDGKVYLYGSRDESAEYWCSYDNDVLSSADLINWTLHKDVFSSRGEWDEIVGTDALLFASDCIYKDSTYYLFFCTPDNDYAEGIAVSSSPIGPFRNGYRLSPCRQIDPSVFIDDDGQIYYYWGQGSLKGAILQPNMKNLEPTTLRDHILTGEEHYFHEGVQAFKRNGIYYLTFADQSRRGKPTCIGYATSISPWGPFAYRGVIIDNYGCESTVWNNHGSVALINGKWYVFYHRSSNGKQTFRKACVEPIEFDDDGLIKEVEMTSQGVMESLNPFMETEARIACQLSGKTIVRTYPDGQERLSNIADGDVATWKYFDFTRIPSQFDLHVISGNGGNIDIYVDNLTTKPLCSVKIPPGDGETMEKVTVGLSSSFLSAGKHSLLFRFSGKKDMELFQLDRFRFE